MTSAIAAAVPGGTAIRGVAAGIDPASGQLRGGADVRRERALVAGKR
jgi:hypothetical protein